MAFASAGETPLAAAIEEISEELTRSGVGYGGPLGEPSATAPTGCEVAADADVGAAATEPPRRRTVPLKRYPVGSRPFSAARLATLSPARAAIPDSVSPA